MTIKEFIKHIFNNVYNLNAHSLAIENPNYQKNGLHPFIKFNEKDIEVKGDFLILKLPEGIELIKKSESE
ncbi:MAG: hypothetical protein PHD05_00440 [Sphaerochaetaceae bacterium]|nr:hypothetical protein [Sphaerochaetaceae bacterium]